MSRAPRRLHRSRWICGFAAVVALSGCSGQYESDFPVIVVNRTANGIQALVNGNVIGDVVAGQTRSFSLNLPESNANIFVGGTAPTPRADVTFTAKDTRTGSLSAEKFVTLSADTPTYVSFTADDFPSTVPTVARFSFSPTNPTINQDVSFNASASSATNATYLWDFGDGQTGSNVTTTHRYLRGGTFTIVLTVTSDNRQTSTASRTINVATTLPPQVSNFTFSPTAPSINQDVVFTVAGAPGPAAQGATFFWDFGDGTSGSGSPISHRYTRGGTFAVTLRVTTDTGLTSTTVRQLTVSTTLPAGTANFTFSPTDPRPGDTVFFNATSSTLLDGNYSWDFGDGGSGSGVTTTHQYSQRRTYTVTLTVRNDRGQSASIAKTITVAEPAGAAN